MDSELPTPYPQVAHSSINAPVTHKLHSLDDCCGTTFSFIFRSEKRFQCTETTLSIRWIYGGFAAYNRFTQFGWIFQFHAAIVMDYVFNGYSNYKNLDYAACWFLLAAKYIHAHGGAYAFVTTNSLTQGEQVSLLWPKLFEYGVHIHFGHTAFKWRNDARNTTAVTVVIIGVVNNDDSRRCELYTQTSMTEPIQISPYLLPGTIFVERRKTPISHLPYMVKGNMPYGADFLLMDGSTKRRAVEQDRRVLEYVKRIVHCS